MTPHWFWMAVAVLFLAVLIFIVLVVSERASCFFAPRIGPAAKDEEAATDPGGKEGDYPTAA